MLEILQKGDGRVFGIVGSKHSGKTTTLFNMIEDAMQYKTDIHCYFYHTEYKQKFDSVNFVNSLNELEQIKDSFIFIDEFSELFMLHDRHATEMIKTIIAQIEHNNNYLVLCGLPNYFNKMVSSAVGDNWLLKSLNYDELVNGSGLKNYVKTLSGDFVGGTRLNIPVDKLLFKGLFNTVKYDVEKDKKANRVDLFEKK